MSRKKTLNEFIDKAKEVHGNKYDYSKVNYINSQEKVCIVCHEHGEFWQLPFKHLKGQGCPKCFRNNLSDILKFSIDEFIKKAKEKHGYKYDYSKVEYINNKTKVCIICPEHGEFWQTPHNHLKGYGCSKCSGNYLHTLNEFIEKSKEIHGDKYGYSKVDYINALTKVCIVCSEHGDFWQTPHNHLKGQGCPKCFYTKNSEEKKLTLEIFIEKAKEIHGDKYDYSKVNYKGFHDKVCILCKEHGEFWQTPAHHLSGQGCRKCNESKLERITRIFLKKHNIISIQEKTFEWLIKDKNLKLDFYLPEYNVAIECQGIQHFKPINYFGGLKGFEYIKKCDLIKKQKCYENGIKLFYVNYYDDIEQNLLEIINKLK